MTQQETTRLAKVEQKVDDLKEQVSGIDSKISGVITRLDNLDKSFITVAQAKAAAWIIGTIISIATIAIYAWEALRSHHG